MPKPAESTKKERTTILPWSEKPETLKTPVDQLDALPVSIETAGSNAMSLLRESSIKLVEKLRTTYEVPEIVKLANALANTVNIQVNVAKVVLESKRKGGL